MGEIELSAYIYYLSKLNIAGLNKYLIQHGNTQTTYITNTSTNKIVLMGRKHLIDLTRHASVELNHILVQETHHPTVIALLEFTNVFIIFYVFYEFLIHENIEDITQTFEIRYIIKYNHAILNVVYSFIDLNIHLRQVDVCFVTFL